ncbi:hypothetical protein P8452_31953 [Trifolium repens]|nr:hypothetical protein P8452_31953 [Trifolium repens]
MNLMAAVTRRRSMSTISKAVAEIVGVSKTKTRKATSEFCTFMGILHHSRSEVSTIISKFIKLYSAGDSYHMENIRQHKIQKYEEFVDKSLKPDLLLATAQRDKVFEQQKIFADLRRNIENLEKNSVTSLRTLVNIGSEVYVQAEVYETSGSDDYSLEWVRGTRGRAEFLSKSPPKGKKCGIALKLALKENCGTTLKGPHAPTLLTSNDPPPHVATATRTSNIPPPEVASTVRTSNVSHHLHASCATRTSNVIPPFNSQPCDSATQSSGGKQTLILELQGKSLNFVYRMMHGQERTLKDEVQQ